MKSVKFILLLAVFVYISSCSSEKEKTVSFLGKLKNTEIDSLLRENAQRGLSITDRMELYSGYFLGTPYNFACAGDGPYALMETFPLVNFKETNCMAYCEHVLALAISDNWDNFFNNLQQIRYQNGIIGMRTRNHYTMADWLPENRWLLMDASRLIGGKYTRRITRTISHKNFFRNKGITDLRYVKPDRKITIDYIPMENLKDVKSGFENGDILALLFAEKTDIFSAHMLMIYKIENELVIRESSNSKMTTFETPFSEWLQMKSTQPRYAGVAVMRVRPELNTIDRVMLPWDITNIKDLQNP